MSLYIFFVKSRASLRAHLSCCKVSSCVLSANFDAQGLRSWGSHFCKTPCAGPFLSRFFQVVPRAFGECDGAIWSQCSNFPQNRFFRTQSWTTQPNCVRSFRVRQLILFHYFSATFYCDTHQPQCVWTDRGRRICIPIQTCNFDTWEDANNYTTVPYAFFWGIVCTSVCPRFWSRRGRLCFMSTIGSVAETTSVSSWTLSSCLPLIALPLSSQRWLSLFWLFNNTSLSNLSFRALKLRVLIIWSMCRLTTVFNFLIAWHCSISIHFLVARSRYCLKLNRPSYYQFVQTFKDILRRCLTCC